jgi:MoxR-like ATPase
MDVDISRINEEVKEASNQFSIIKTEIEKVIVGQGMVLDRLLIALLTEGHVLVEGVPGLAKTMTIKALASSLDLAFKRIQFTPDLLPADIVGTQVFNPKTGDFSVRKGPVFANFILADEINRAPSKVQSALLEAMQEKQVTLAEETFVLARPFLVMATQNPIEQEGTYPLPEAQVDRFLMKVIIEYPSKAEELEIVSRMARGHEPEAKAVMSRSEILRFVELINRVYIDEKVEDYIVNLVLATRDPKAYKVDIENTIHYGASPRASIALHKTARAHAFIKGRGYVTPQDVKSVAKDVLRHRILLTYEADAEDLTSDRLIERILEKVAVP